MDSVNTPDMLNLAVERMFLDLTEPLDTMLSLQMLQVVRSLVNIAYTMGHSDGKQVGAPFNPCSLCPHQQA
jgi:hypothetical protein